MYLNLKGILSQLVWNIRS